MQIKFDSIVKKYKDSQGNELCAVDGVSLVVPSNKIFGIIGKSGAGKSTLVRLISLLEKPDSGTIYYNDLRVDNLSKQELIERHRHIGMIFQNFNLFSSRTASQNIAYPLEICKVPKNKIQSRVQELLELVGLSDRANAPVSTLSGGQKQRIAIARALANNPDILFCDEATSALDPQTTKSILSLIRSIQKKMNLTVVMITHQMEVVRDACEEVAVLDEGKVVEQGKVSEIFSNPKSPVTKDFLSHLSLEEIKDNNSTKKMVRWSNEGGEYTLRFTGKSPDEPLISAIVKKFNVDVNIRASGIHLLSQEEKVGIMIADINGDKKDIQGALSYLKENGVNVSEESMGAEL